MGAEVVLDQVLALGNGAELKVGAPLVAGASVKRPSSHGSMTGSHLRDAHLLQKSQGHRQNFTEVANQLGQRLIAVTLVLPLELIHGTEKGGGSAERP